MQAIAALKSNTGYDLINVGSNYDPDYPDGDALTYKWTAPAGITLSSSTAQKPTFPAPKVINDSTLIFSLVVNDGELNSLLSQVSVLVKNEINVGINDETNPSFLTFPNPGSKEVKITFQLSLENDVNVRFYNTSGNCVIENLVKGRQGYNILNLSTSVLASGIYWIELTTGNNAFRMTGKWVKR